MLKAAHPFKKSMMTHYNTHNKNDLKKAWPFLVVFLWMTISVPGFAKEIKVDETGLYADVFNQNIYYEGTNFLHLDRLYRRITNKKIRAQDVNAYDEVPDSSFFTNRHARKPLSTAELTQGYFETEGPDFGQGLTILKGKFEGVHPGFFVKDSKGDGYLLKFDGEDSLELQTSAEIIASRFFYALGYNVPQYTVSTFTMDQISIDANAIVYDDTGFKKKLTREHLDQYLTFIPQDNEGQYRASASKILPGVNKGVFRFHGKRRSNPEDTIRHERLRSLRALRVFESWINDYDIRESNTLDMLVEENGRKTLKHYLIDFNDALGSADGAKPPMSTHEHLMDYGEATKALLTLGLWEKPWQKRWKDAGENLMNVSPAVGYFDNRFFDPSKYKTQLPHFVFKDLTRADALWASKIVMSFSNEDIKAIVQAGKLSHAEDADLVTKILIARRDIIGKYWFEKSSPLDDFSVQANTLIFKDLGVAHGFWTQEQTTYQTKVIAVQGKKGSVVSQNDFKQPSADLGSNATGDTDVMIRTVRSGSEVRPAHVLIQIRGGHIAGVIHQD